jgi:hypothetical protein
VVARSRHSGSDGGAAATQESIGAAVGLDLSEDRLDDRLGPAVERCAVLARQNAADEVIEPAAAAGARTFVAVGVCGDKRLQTLSGERFDRTVLVDDPTNQQAVRLTPHGMLMGRPQLFLSGGARISLMIICECAVARRVVAP